MMKITIKNQGFTLAELVIVLGILSFTLTGMMRLFVYTSVQADMAKNKMAVLSEAQTKIEQIREHPYSLIPADFGATGTPGNIFPLTLINGTGVVTVDNSNAELLVIRVVVSWQNKYGRIIGEDTNLNGILDGSEDINSNGVLDSDVTLISKLTRR